MRNNQKVSGRADSIPVGLSVSAISSILLTIVCVMILTKLVDTGKMQWESIGYAIMVQTIVVSFIGAKIAHKRVKRQTLLICLLSGLIYYAFLVATVAAFFGGKYEGMAVTALLVLAGCVCASLLGLRSQKGSHHNIMKKRHC